jgi:hypothetical protein
VNVSSPAKPTDDPLPNLVNGDSGSPKTAPAPWVTYTRAGCDVGNVSIANTVLENNSIAPGGRHLHNVYGTGIEVHCAQVSTSICNKSAHAKDDLLPDEPGGYTGFKALFGAEYLDPGDHRGQAGGQRRRG